MRPTTSIPLWWRNLLVCPLFIKQTIFCNFRVYQTMFIFKVQHGERRWCDDNYMNYYICALLQCKLCSGNSMRSALCSREFDSQGRLASIFRGRLFLIVGQCASETGCGSLDCLALYSHNTALVDLSKTRAWEGIQCQEAVGGGAGAPFQGETRFK